MIEYAGSGSGRGERAVRGELAQVGLLARRIDWLLMLAVVGLVAYGLWAIAGITRHDVAGDPGYFARRQAIYVVLGAVGFLLGFLVDPEFLQRRKRLVYGLTVGAMVLVFLAGSVSRGSRRWISLGSFQLQPSEFGKLLFVLALAGFAASRPRRTTSIRAVLEIVLIGLFPILLVFVQPDIGTALVYLAALAAVLFVSGVRWLHLGVLAAVTVLGVVGVLWLLPAAGVHPLKQYQVDRLIGFTNPSKDPSGTTYNINQSMTAVGAGGLRGRGVSGATQTALSYLPEHQTDFVFASLSEQRGFVGGAFLLLLYLLVVWRGLRVITVAQDVFGAIVAGGIVVGLLFQVFVNIGMTMGIAPITGIPAPFLSVGGSAMVANLTAIGVLQSIHARGRLGLRRRGGSR